MNIDAKPKGVGADQVAASEFVETFGLLWERLGANRTVGRMLAWLTICDPPEQTADEIVQGLKVSQASVSTAARTLEAMGMVERVSLPGNRRVHYRVPPGAWGATSGKRLREFDSFIEAAELGRDAVASQPAAMRRRIDGLLEWATWWRERYGQMLSEWEKR